MKRSTWILIPLCLALVGFACTKKSETTTPAKAEAKTDATEKRVAATQPEAKDITPDSATVSVLEVSACQSVESRTPVGIANKFPSDIGRVYVFTKVGLDASAKSKIHHVWRYNGKEVAKVTLPVQGPQWRTYSSKRIDGSHKGAWQVDIVTGEKAVLSSVSFQIE